MRTERDRLWDEYYTAVRTGHTIKAKELLKRIQGNLNASSRPNNSGTTPVARQARGGGCSRCRRRI